MSIDSLPRLAGIYLITCVPTGIVYVGSSQNIRRRLNQHIASLKRNDHYNQFLQRAYNKYGKDCFEVSVLELCVKSRLVECELFWFKKYGVGDKSRCFNINIVPESMHGTHHSEATKSKISIANKGKKKSPEHIAKLKAAKKSNEHREKLSEANKGHKLKPETIAKMIQATAQKYIVTTPDGIEYEIIGLNKFCRENGLDRSTMAKIARGIKRTCKGWKCRRAE